MAIVLLKRIGNRVTELQAAWQGVSLRNKTLSCVTTLFVPFEWPLSHVIACKTMTGARQMSDRDTGGLGVGV
jgi:hypothetical protein